MLAILSNAEKRVEDDLKSRGSKNIERADKRVNERLAEGLKKIS